MRHWVPHSSFATRHFFYNGPMANPLTLARVWRILKEVDLDAIRREAETPVRVLVVGDTTTDADALAVLLAEDQPDPTPWLTSVDAALAREGIGNLLPGNKVPGTFDLVLLVSRGPQLSNEMTVVRQAWVDRGVSLVTVALESGERPGKVRTEAKRARVSVDRLDARSMDAVAAAIFHVVTPDQRIALARELPGLRACVFEALVSETAKANAGYAFSTGLAEVIPLLDIPLNIGDVIVLTKNQLVMGYRIALAAGKEGRAARPDRGDRRRARRRTDLPADRAPANRSRAGDRHRPEGRGGLRGDVGDRPRGDAVGHGGREADRRPPARALA